MSLGDLGKQAETEWMVDFYKLAKKFGLKDLAIFFYEF